MMRRIVLVLALFAPGVSLAQPKVVVDSLVDRATASWGVAPRGGWCVEWHVVRGDTTTLRAATAELSGSGRTGMYTVTMRATPFAAPTLVARLRIGHERSETVSARPIARATTLTDADLLVEHTTAWGAPTAQVSEPIAQLIGMQTRRALRSGEILRGADVTAATVVHAGDSVRAEIVRDGVRLAVAATALHDAPLGARVNIRLDRGRRFAGIATGRNTVRLD